MTLDLDPLDQGYSVHLSYEFREQLALVLVAIVAKAFDVPEQFVACQKLDYEWMDEKGGEILVRLLKVYDEEEKDKICDVINSTSLLANINSGIGEIEGLADEKIAMKSNIEPLIKVLTGRQLIF